MKLYWVFERPDGYCGPLPRFLLQHGTFLTLEAINQVIQHRENAPLLELMLDSGLPLPAVPRGSAEESVAMWGGEFNRVDEVRRGRRKEAGTGPSGGRGETRVVEGAGNASLQVVAFH